MSSKPMSLQKKMDALTKETSDTLTLAAEAMKCRYDYTHVAATPFAVGDLVLVKSKGLETTQPSKKLDNKCYDPFPINELVGIQSYCLGLPLSWKIHNVFHTSKLVPYITPAFPSQLEPVLMPELENAQPIL